VYGVNTANLGFYRDLFRFLGWSTIVDSEGMLGLGSGPASIWFGPATRATENHYDAIGLNHLGIGTESAADVDAAAAYLSERGVALLFDTPRHRPEFSHGPGHTYYQIMFESPDRLLFEIVYIGAK
jgi:hypothetical protein